MWLAIAEHKHTHVGAETHGKTQSKEITTTPFRQIKENVHEKDICVQSQAAVLQVWSVLLSNKGGSVCNEGSRRITDH